MNYRCFWIIIAYIHTLLSVHAQANPNDTLAYRKNLKTNLFPVLFYLPETGLGFGVAGIAAWRMKGETVNTRVSSVQLGLSFTTKKQFLFFLPYEVYWDDERWRLTGELGWYKYFYNYFGRSNQSIEGDLQLYNVNFPRLRSSLLRDIGQSFLIGIGYQYDAYNKLSFDGVGVLQQEQEEAELAGNITVSKVGLILMWDNRDHLFYPKKGGFVQLDLHNSSSIFASSQDFISLIVDARYFIRLSKSSVLATNLNLGLQSKEVPFLHYAYVGSKLTRGFADRRYQDQSILSTTIEFRQVIGASRFGVNVFASAAAVGKSFFDVISDKKHISGGVGIRYVINERDGVRLRLDYGLSKEGGQLYFTIGEAF